MASDRPSAWEHLVLYDGGCGLCHRSVRWLLARDRDARLRFAPLDGETARDAGLAESPASQDTLKYVTGGTFYTRSRAFFALLAVVHSRWAWLRVFRFLPAWLTDLPYRLVARVRYRIFGRADACALPAPGQASRFLP
jgi:predicted DCC family thiol-disulfide oxidoreductase YuxK